MARKPKKQPTKRGLNKGYINPTLERFQFQATNPGQWTWEEKIKYQSMSTEQLAKVARKMAKQSNQRLVRLEQQGLTNSYAYNITMGFLKGQGESVEAQKRGFASFATKTGKRFKENTSNMDKQSLLYMLQNMYYHLNRNSTVGRQRSYYSASVEGMREALERRLMETYPEYKYGNSKSIVSDSDLVTFFESVEYKELAKHVGYKTAVQKFVDSSSLGDKVAEAMATYKPEQYTDFFE